MLTDLQVRIARLVAELPGAERFALAGGAGLIVHQVTDRTTSDLDFFTPRAGDVALLLPALEGALREQGYEVTRERAVGTFARITVTDGTQRWALAEMLGQFDRLSRQEFEIDDASYRALGTEVAGWRDALNSPRKVDPQRTDPPGAER